MRNQTDLTRRGFLAGVAAPLAQAAPPRRPNVLFILADQWRPQTLPSSGDPDLHAPSLAKLAAGGVHFERCYVTNPVCSPSRASLITGRFPRSCSMPHNNLQLPLDQPSVAAELKRAGYATGYIGKWHLDGEPRPGFVPPGPRRRGFDYWAAFNRGHFYYDSTYYRDADQPIRKDGFEPDYQTDLAIDFIRANRARPFCLYVSWGPPHTPRKPPERYARYYKPAQFRPPPNVPKKYEQQARTGRAAYYGLCSALDDNVGRLLGTLDEAGVAEDTIVVFTSDHGDMLGSHGLEFKGVPYEESARVPLLMRYPRKLKSGRRNLLVSNVDLMPTLLGFCGAPAPAAVQGRDHSRRILLGEGPRPESIYCEGRTGEDGGRGEWRMVVRGTEKLVTDREWRVTHYFDIAADPFEMRNRAAEGAKRSDLLALVREWHGRAVRV